MTDLASVLGDLLADVATRVSNQALNIDPQLRARLQSLSGNTIEINCTMPPVIWHLTIVGGSLQLNQGPAQTPQVIVQGSAMQLASRLFPGTENAQDSHLSIQGDETLLLELVAILRDFEPDLQDPLGQLLGPQLATSVLGTAEMGLKGIRSMIEGVGRSFMSDMPDMPGKPGAANQPGQSSGSQARSAQQAQLDSVLNGIDELRLQVDRLAARVSAQENQQSENPADNRQQDQ